MARASHVKTRGSTTESTPPERPSARCVPGEIAGASAAAALSGNSLEFEFLELPITHQALETLLDECRGTLVGKTAQGVAEGFLQALGHGRRIAMRAPQGLVDDPVDQPESLQPAGGNSQRFGRLR